MPPCCQTCYDNKTGQYIKIVNKLKDKRMEYLENKRKEFYKKNTKRKNPEGLSNPGHGKQYVYANAYKKSNFSFGGFYYYWWQQRDISRGTRHEKAMQVHPNVVISSLKVTPQVEEDKNESKEMKLIDRTEAQDNVIEEEEILWNSKESSFWEYVETCKVCAHGCWR
jgi:hypothetical protein